MKGPQQVQERVNQSPEEPHGAWFAESRDQVLAAATHFGLAQAVTPEQRRLLAIALAGLRASASKRLALPYIHLPLLVHAGLRGDDRPARLLALATCLLFLGIDLLDDLADRDLTAHWEGMSEAEVQLVATGLLSTLPQLA